MCVNVRATQNGVANVRAALPVYCLCSHPHPSLVAPGTLPSRGDEPLLGKDPAPKPGVGRSMVPTDATPVLVLNEFLKFKGSDVVNWHCEESGDFVVSVQ